MSTTKARKQEMEEARETLKGMMKEGDRLYTILKSVAPSGMSRVISVLKVDGDGDIVCLDHLIARAGIYNLTSSTARQRGLRVNGAGMDMGYDLVYTVSHFILGDGYKLKQEWL